MSTPPAAARIMAHVVCGYPDQKRSQAAAEALVAGGAQLLELQFPFSDPVADGAMIQEANAAALAAGFRVQDGFRQVGSLRAALDVEIYIMTYAAIPCAVGVERFVERAAASGAAGLIVPDLPPDNDEGLAAACKRVGIEAVPVTVADAQPERLALACRSASSALYVALRRGITGDPTHIAAQTLETLQRLARGGTRIWAGFGVHSREQVMALSRAVDAVVVGSHFTRIMRRYANAPQAEMVTALRRAVETLIA